ncbi:TraR/DksA family transcriptional regulator [Streptomyces sp. NPDC020875]|uniref:TraR/DksA family transcriptional regulator n=1 Tax=Streptomyces sp. NPDC020875 TaxID=3154898 RepID=UPI0033D0DB42
MVAKKTAAKKTTATRAAAEKAPSAPSEPAVPAKKTAAKKAAKAVKKAPGKEPGKKAAAKKTVAKKTVAKKAAAGKTTAKKTTVKKTTAKKTAAKKTAGAAKKAVTETGARTVGAKKTVAVGEVPTGVPTARAAAPAGELAVRPGEEPWSPEEVAEARAVLAADVTRLNAELAASGAALAGLMRDSGGGAGDDDADTGTKNITREHELALAAKARENLEQTERALLRLDAGTYGSCENCGKPIGKARMQAFPRATLCVECKQKQERRG